MVKEDLLTNLYKMASKSPNREICGVITDDFLIFPIINTAKENNHFVLQKSGYFRTLNLLKETGKSVWAIYHSHVNGDAAPSSADREASRRTGFNYLIVTPQGTYSWVEV